MNFRIPWCLRSLGTWKSQRQVQTRRRGFILLPWAVTSGRPSCKCEKALPGGRGVKCRRRSESSRGRCGPGPESPGSRPGRLAPPLLALAHVGSSVLTGGWRPAPGPPGDMTALSSEYMLASQFLLLCLVLEVIWCLSEEQWPSHNRNELASINFALFQLFLSYFAAVSHFSMLSSDIYGNWYFVFTSLLTSFPCF